MLHFLPRYGPFLPIWFYLGILKWAIFLLLVMCLFTCVIHHKVGKFSYILMAGCCFLDFCRIFVFWAQQNSHKITIIYMRMRLANLFNWQIAKTNIISRKNYNSDIEELLDAFHVLSRLGHPCESGSYCLYGKFLQFPRQLWKNTLWSLRRQ